MRKGLRLIYVLSLVFGGITIAGALTIDFDDGTQGLPVGEFYSDLGVIFENTVWTENFGLPGSSGTLGIRAEDNGGAKPPNQWLQLYAVVATFSEAVSEASIVGVDVGENGLRIDAYDDLVDGNLIDFDEAFGTGVGGGQFFTVTANNSFIRRVEIYQVTDLLPNDGIVLDNFSFSTQVPIPEPSSILLLGFGLIALAGFSKKKFMKK